MVWIDFIICYFFGVFGVHKFREKKIGLGILYLCTCGLFGIGWLVDCVKYLITAINYTKNNMIQKNYSTPTTYASPYTNEQVNIPHIDSNNYENTSNSSFFVDNTKANTTKESNMKIIRWVCFGLLVFFALIFFFSFSSICAILCAIMIAPIEPIQEFINKYVKKKIKITISIVLAVIALFSVPNTPIDEHKLPNEDNKFATTVEETQKATEPATETIHTHEFLEATCKSPKTCSICNETEGETIAHEWQEADCTTPKKCNLCEETEGEPSGHDWKEATCTSPKKCKVCDKTSGEAKGHNYQDGYCTNCDASDPNYVHETMVYIPTNGGQKYHSKSTCSQMDNPDYVTISEAINLGFTPCGRCY